MNLPSKNAILFNGGAGLLILVGTVALIKTAIFPADIERCTARYRVATSFDLGDENGAPLTPGAMQGRLGAGQWGILQNLTINKRSTASGDLVMRVGLSRTAGAQRQDDGSTGGLGFRWVPGFLAKKSSACLSYDVRLPKGFDFRAGGVLPGLVAGQDAEDAPLQIDADGEQADHAGREGFAARISWDANGKGGIQLQSAGAATSNARKRVDLAKYNMPTGRWVNLEQEISLNSIGKQDGILRIWVDGELMFEKKDIRFRNAANTKFLGVTANTRYNAARLKPRRSKPQSLAMTPFKLMWN